MNKYQEAYKEIECIEVYEYAGARVAAFKMEREYENELKTLKELVDRATPKKAKVVPSDKLRFDGLCPNCNRPLFDGSDMFFKEKRYQFCAYCGQALDWSESTTDSTHNELDDMFAENLDALEKLGIKK